MRTGKTIGTAALLPVNCGFKPSRVELFCSESSAYGYWENTMRDGTFAAMGLRELRTSDIIFGRHLPFIGSTTTQLGNRRITAQFNGAGGTPIEIASTLAGTAFTATTHDITTSLWRSFRLSAVTNGTITITHSASEYATEALAIAALAALPAVSVSLGYITVQAPATGTWDATTCSLAGGTSGSYPAAETNYYEGYAVESNGITVYGAADYTAQIAAAITPIQGFTIGTDALLNVLGSIIEWKAYRD
jgi:hypothetical protein